jgi:hypothetical protein
VTAPLGEIELCFFSALIDGLRLINEKADARKITDVEIDANALADYVQDKGQQILIAVQTERKVDLREVLASDRKSKYGRGGIPEPVVQAMIDEYRRTNSLHKVGKTFGRTRQSMWCILRTRIALNPTHKILHKPTFYNGRKFTPGKGGYLRLSAGRNVKRILLHRIVWEDHFGPIPAGFVVMFRDGNRLNCAPSNLKLIGVKEQLAEVRNGENAATKLRRLQAAGVTGDELERTVEAFENRPRGEAQSERLRKSWAAYSPEARANRIRSAAQGRNARKLKLAA